MLKVLQVELKSLKLNLCLLQKKILVYSLNEFLSTAQCHIIIQQNLLELNVVFVSVIIFNISVKHFKDGRNLLFSLASMRPNKT